MKVMGIPAIISSLVLLFPGASRSAPPDSFRLYEAARLPAWANWRYVTGDADHDSRPEIYATLHVDSLHRWNPHAFEHMGGFRFDSTRLDTNSETAPIMWAMGDIDRDGLTDLVRSDEVLQGRRLAIYESPSRSTLPVSMVWADTMSVSDGAMWPVIADTDQDSAREVLMDASGEYGVRLYECTGVNQYTLKTRVFTNSLLCLAAADDLDRDGKPELCVGRGTGVVLIYEAVADDSLEFVDCCSLPRLYGGATPVCALAVGPDIDRDGRLELFVLGVENSGAGFLGVIEAPADDSFEIVWSHGFQGVHAPLIKTIAVGDIDGDSVPEVATCDARDVRIYQHVEGDSYTVVWQTWNGQSEIALHDLNHDGHCELIVHQRGYQTIIYAYGDSGAVAESDLRSHAALSVRPTVVRNAPYRIANVPSAAEVEVLDATGRVVARPEAGVWYARGVAPGAYFIRIRVGNQAVVRKVLVLR